MRASIVRCDSLHARSYFPYTARFLSVDPGRDYDFSRPQSFNLYTYVRNNPVNLTDPDGRLANWVIGGLIGAGIGAVGEVARQLLAREPVSLRNTAAAAAGGLISGAIAGGTFGASLVAKLGVGGAIVAGTVANTAGGVVQRELDEKPTTVGLEPKSMIIDAMVGGIGGGAGRTVEQAGRAAISGEVVALQSAVARRQAIVDARRARGVSPMSAGWKVARDNARLEAIERKVTTLGVVAGTTTTNAAAPMVIQRVEGLLKEDR